VNVSDQPATIGEFLAAALILAAVVAGQFLLVDGAAVLSRHLWLDEVHTALIAGDASTTHALQALADGADTNPPTLFLILRWSSRAAGGLSPATMRGFSLGWMALALLGTYVALRRSVGPLAAAAGVLVMWNTPLVLRHAVEARFYAPLLASTAWFCLAVSLMRDRRTWTRAFLLAVTSLLMCTMHYFGIFAWCCVVVAVLATDWRSIGRRMGELTPALAGPAGLAACVPLLIAQRRALGATTWLPDVNARLLFEYARDLMPWWPALLLLMAVLVGAALLKSRRSPSVTAWRGLLPLLACGGVPIIVLCFSMLAQPALLARYGIAFELSVAAIAAALAARLARLWRIALCAALLASSTILSWRTAQAMVGPGGDDEQIVRLIEDLRRTQPDRAILFDMRQQHYAVVYAAPDLAERCWFIGLGADGPGAPPIASYERRIAAAVARHYPAYQVCDVESLVRGGPYYLVTTAPASDVVQRLRTPARGYAPMVYELWPSDR
jgi:hypothetical protein